MKNIIIDANIAVSLLIPLPYSDQSGQQMDVWLRESAIIAVPVLLRYEVLSSLRKAVAQEFISIEQAKAGLLRLKQMGFEEIPPSEERDERALDIAGRIKQVVAYDAVYLALAEEMDAEFWTADRRLADAARLSGVEWVHLL